jgi:hypothetical protein
VRSAKAFLVFSSKLDNMGILLRSSSWIIRGIFLVNGVVTQFYMGDLLGSENSKATYRNQSWKTDLENVQAIERIISLWQGYQG